MNITLNRKLDFDSITFYSVRFEAEYANGDGMLA
jgi:hypothetical protein